MIRATNWRSVFLVLLGSATLALICLFDIGPQFRAVRSLGGALVIGAAVAYGIVSRMTSLDRLKKTIVAAALVGLIAALIYLLVMLIILTASGSIEVILSTRNTEFMLKFSLLLTLFSTAGGLITTTIIRLIGGPKVIQ